MSAPTYAVVTTTTEEAYKNYGKECILSFSKYWPSEIKLHVFLEEFHDSSPDNSRIIYYDLHKTIPELENLKKRNNNRKEIIEKKKSDIINNIKAKPYKDKTYLFDYIRFSNKSYVIFYGLEKIDVDCLIWLDIDTKTHKDIDDDFLKSINPENLLVSALKRPKTYTETGFLAFNRRNPIIKEYLKIAKDIYDNDRIYNIDYFNKGFTDCHVFDYTIEKLTKSYGELIKNLNTNNTDTHPFINSILGKYMDHFKGERRKKEKRSNPNEIRYKDISNASSYWNLGKIKDTKEKNKEINKESDKNISKIPEKVKLKNLGSQIISKHQKNKLINANINNKILNKKEEILKNIKLLKKNKLL